MDLSTLRKIQLLELKMLKCVVSIFNKYGIKYYLSGGSVLGAIRHKGFIPWDDDLDIMVPRFYYDKLEEIFSKELPEEMIYQNHNNCKEFPYIFSRVIYRNTALVFAGVEHLSFHHGIHIDIQPLDKVPEGKLFKIFIKKMRLYKLILNLSYLNNYRKGKKRSLWKRLIIKIIHLAVNKEILHRIIDNNMRKYENKDVKGVACLGGIYGEKEGFPEFVLGDGIQMKFEDDYFIIPEKYDYYLKQLYGDYMTPPPENERGTHHDIIFYSLAEEYDRNRHLPWK